MTVLLAVDLGVQTGLAAYGIDGRLQWYRSHNFGSPARLRRGVPGIVRAIPGLSHLVVEGGGDLARAWASEAEAHALHVTWVTAEEWRTAFLYPRQRLTGEIAKQSADEIARRVIDVLGARPPTSLRHDAAEAILIGLWEVLRLGWLPPAALGSIR